ncbi:acyltransferase family protein [Pseudomonas sp. RT6P73]
MNLNLSNTEVAQAKQSLENDRPAKFRNDIQGLRAIAALAVILYHLNRNWLPAGFLGVDVFCVVSGFIVTTIAFERGRIRFFRSFYLGRIRRIVPVYLVLLLFSCLAASVLLVPADFKYFQESLESALLFLSNSYFSNFGSYLVACFLLVEADHFPGTIAILPCVATVLLIVGYKSSVDSWLSNPVLVWIARVWQWQSQRDAFLKVLAEFAKTLFAQGKRVIVLAQLPMFEENVQRMQRFALLGMEIAPEQSANWVSGNSKVAERRSGTDNVFFVGLSQIPFFQHAPYGHGVLIYQDNHHLNERGARRYGELAAPVLAKLIFPLH